MRNVRYLKVADEAGAIAAGAQDEAAFIAGGTTLVDLMKLEVVEPAVLVDVNGLALDKIDVGQDGIQIGAMVRNSDLAYHPEVAKRYPVLAEALLSGASAQIRNMATVGGNLLQRTRCPYFRDRATACNKRAPGTGCSAIGGYTRNHAVLGVSEHCIAAHPSDMCVALAALDAVVHVRGTSGERKIPFGDFHTLPGEHPERDSILERGELVTAVWLPAMTGFSQSRYLKVRDRASYAFALVSVAAALRVEGGRIRDARVALGGVGTKPWRSLAAEQALAGKAPTRAAYVAAAQAAMADAKPQKHNTFKVGLAQRAIVRALESTRGAT
jgi:xanthine dehydrogenase YagS FAD-binding subunit